MKERSNTLENLYDKYKIIADYHTHTVYSHGKGSIEDNVKKAIEKGLKTIAITDHGSKHFIFGVSEKRLLKQKEEIVQIRKKYPDFQLLFGVESNITGIDGGYDITSGFENNFDIILCGFHKPVWADKLSDYTNIFYNSYSHFIYEPTKEQIEKNTKAYINLIKSKPIDIISHINYHLKVDMKEVAKAASDYGVAIEVSSRHSDCTGKDYENLFASSAMLTLNSDAHKVDDIGNIDKALAVIDKYNVDAKRILNSEYCEFKFKSRTK